MATKEIILASLNESWGYLNRALNGLTQEEITWRPAPQSNTIAFLLWHVTRGEDWYVTAVTGRGSAIYDTEGWRERLGTPMTGGNTYTEEQIQSWPTPPLKDLRAYSRVVHKRTLDFLNSITPEELLEVRRPDRVQMTVGTVLAHLITEIAMHVGQIDYLRGMQRGLKRRNWW